MIIIEGLVVCFIVLFACVLGIANGPQGLVILYDKPVQDRVVELGLMTRKQIMKNAKIFDIFGLGVAYGFTLLAVYGINGARGFWEGFWQITVIWFIEGIFDRFFIDWYWVNHTKAWVIPGTEDLRPYINKKDFVKKWVLTIVGYPLIGAILSGIMMLFVK